MAIWQVHHFYDELAAHYHLIFEDWDRAIERQGEVLDRLLVTAAPPGRLKILDCACGIGTQTIGFAVRGHEVVASDLSPAAVRRAGEEFQRRSLPIACYISDMTCLEEIPDSDFDVVVALDNALPHLTLLELEKAAEAISSKLKAGGLFVASIRNYDQLVLEKPAVQDPAFYGSGGERRIVHQVWDWIDEQRYAVHLYITMKTNESWQTMHFMSEYRSLLRQELSNILISKGFTGVRWLMPAESGFYQPLVLATWQGAAIV